MRKFIVVLLGLGIWSASWRMGFVPPIKAACYCQDPSVCRCSTAPPASAKNEAVIGGVAVVCDTPGEASNIFAIKSPICGSSPEIIPACAPYKDGSGNYACYGRSFATQGNSVNIDRTPDNTWVCAQPGSGCPPLGEFTFNGVTRTATNVYVCDADNFCCSPGDNNPGCDASQVPLSPGSCPDQNINVTPPVSICGVVAGAPNPNTQPNFTGQSDTDARIYFPHVKNTSAITYLLQSMYRPISWTIDEIKNNVIYSKLFEHQGIAPDDTKVINTTDNNSALIPNTPAPSPPYSYAAPPYSVANLKTDANCSISDVRINPGDDLLGKKIYSELQYTQKFEYDLMTDCVHTGQTTTKPSECCGGHHQVGTQPPLYECEAVYQGYPLQGKALVYTKSPYLEYLYQNLVAGPAAIYKRFVSQDTAKDIKDTPTKATILASTNANKLLVSDQSQSAQTPIEIYFPHLGSIYDNFLKNLQKLLRPKDTADTTTINSLVTYQPGQTPINPTCQASCSHPNLPPSLQQITAVAGGIYNVPPSLIIGILWSEGGLNSPITDTDVHNNLHPSCNCPNGQSGACGPAQIIGSADGFLKKLALPQVQALAANLGWNINLPYTPNRCTYSDSIFEIADKLQVGRSGWDYGTHCNPIMNQCESQQCLGVTMNKNVGQSTSCNWSDIDVITAARQYLGYCEEQNHQPLFSKNLSTAIDCRPNPTQCYDNPTDACKGNPNECYQQKLLNFMASNCLQNYSQPTSTVPPNPPPIVSGGGFTVSGSFSQICQSVWYGIRRQAGTSNCVRCFGGQVASGFGSTSNVFRCPQSIVDLNANVCQDSESDFSVTRINSPDNWCARCFQKNVIDMRECTGNPPSTAPISCPTSQICRVSDTSANGLDLYCQPQVCKNPGVVSGSGTTTSGQGYFCCAPKP